MKNNLFYEIKNKSDDVVEIYIYGVIIGGSLKWDESDVTFKDFKDALEGLKGKETVNLYINSPGGSVPATQGMVAMMQRAQAKGVTINAYIDGLGASCASILPMVADNIYTYNSSMLMIHKPMMPAYGNANDLQEVIELLDKFEDSVMVPLYMSKAKKEITEEDIKAMMSAETWLDVEDMCKTFDINVLDTEKQMVACVDKDMLAKYKNTPQIIKDLVNVEIKPKEVEPSQSEKTVGEFKLAKAKLELALL